MPEKIPHSVDGIEEYNNPIPGWLMWILYVSMAFAAVYWVLYPGFWPGASGWDQHKMYQEEVQAADAKYASIRAKMSDINVLITDAKAIAEGKDIFAQNCAACHGVDATGGIGPNLADKEWLYGGNPAQIVKTVSDGTAKGMPAWGSQLGPVKAAKVSAYVHSLGGEK